DALPARAGNRCARRHGQLGNYCANVVAEHGSEVHDQRLGGSRFATRSMENQVEPPGTVKPVDDGHESVLIGVSDLRSRDLRLLKPPRVVDDDVTTSLLCEGLQPLPT